MIISQPLPYSLPQALGQCKHFASFLNRDSTDSLVVANISFLSKAIELNDQIRFCVHG